MSLAASPARITPDEFLERPDHHHFELVAGELEEIDKSVLSSLVGMTVGSLLKNHCEPNNLGWVFGADLYYRCFPDDPEKLRKPDVSFIRRDRLNFSELEEAGFCRIAPDLAVEVVSKNDISSRLETKIGEYFDAGVPLIWVVDPIARIVRVHRPDGSSLRLREDQELTGMDVVPGFSCRVADLFPPRPAER